MIRYVAFYTLLFCVPGACASAADAFDRKPWLEDYAYLKHALEREDANLAWFASAAGGLDLPALDRRTQRALASAADEADAKAALLGFIGAFHGHTAALPALAPAVKSAEPPRLDFAGLDAAAGCAALGFGSTKSVAFSLPFESLPGFTLVADGSARSFRTGVASAGGKRLGLLRIPYFRPAEYLEPCLGGWRDAAAATADPAKLKERLALRVYATVAERLAELARRGVDVLVVDVGGNSGGDDMGEFLTRLFTTRNVQSARLMMTAGPVATAYLDERVGDLKRALQGGDGELARSAEHAIAGFEARKRAVEARRCDMAWVWRERRPWNPAGCSRLVDVGYASGALDDVAPTSAGDLAQALYWPAVVDAWRGAWSGPVYVLTNGQTYSSAEMFTARMRDNGVARTVGTATGGDGCGFMQDDVPIVLPHSRLRFRAPDCVRLRADGTDEVAGIAPDVPIAPTDGESPRARAARALEAIAADFAHSKAPSN
ncbi:MAG TPA: S41 family peptidase [Rudaea sp.]|nr:S41 family peptidase [Rudaea sp.]